jgi:hypothetical protein
MLLTLFKKFNWTAFWLTPLTPLPNIPKTLFSSFISNALHLMRECKFQLVHYHHPSTRCKSREEFRDRKRGLKLSWKVYITKQSIFINLDSQKASISLSLWHAKRWLEEKNYGKHIYTLTHVKENFSSLNLFYLDLMWLKWIDFFFSVDLRFSFSI